ncbi:MAG: FHA domain-containing protein [Thiogranum sp.]|jgi:pSer/pThr/pTyr-binding forkhead associated (FHA) protein|nr:FHA domain-containing protein [Thiogranum sp.]
MFKLLEMIDGNVIREHPLTGEVFCIGRNPGNDLQPDEPSVSGSHATIRLLPSDYLEGTEDVIVEDHGSTNGTLVNGKRIKQQRLRHGDLLAMGALRFKLVDEQALALGGTRILLEDDQA